MQDESEAGPLVIQTRFDEYEQCEIDAGKGRRRLKGRRM
jgi:hypothetical protein